MAVLGVHAAIPASAIPQVLVPVQACAYCWYTLHAHDGQPFPARLSSTICAEHEAWIRRQRGMRLRGVPEPASTRV
jgi:hypothetical protein